MQRPIWILIVLAIAEPASAQDRWTIAVYLGAAHTRAGNLSLAQPALNTDLTFDGVTFRGRSFESPIYYGYRIARDLPFGQVLSIEAEVTHAKAYARTEREVFLHGRRNDLPVMGTAPMAETVEALSMSHGLNLIFVNIAARLPIGSRESRWRIVARVGAGPTLPHAETTIGGRHQEQYELGGFGSQAAGGVEIQIAKRVSGLAEYRFTRARESLTVADGRAHIVLRTHHLILGVAIRL